MTEAMSPESLTSLGFKNQGTLCPRDIFVSQERKRDIDFLNNTCMGPTENSLLFPSCNEFTDSNSNSNSSNGVYFKKLKRTMDCSTVGNSNSNSYSNNNNNNNNNYSNYNNIEISKENDINFKEFDMRKRKNHNCGINSFSSGSKSMRLDRDIDYENDNNKYNRYLSNFDSSSNKNRSNSNSSSNSSSNTDNNSFDKYSRNIGNSKPLVELCNSQLEQLRQYHNCYEKNAKMELNMLETKKNRELKQLKEEKAAFELIARQLAEQLQDYENTKRFNTSLLEENKLLKKAVAIQDNRLNETTSKYQGFIRQIEEQFLTLQARNKELETRLKEVETNTTNGADYDWLKANHGFYPPDVF